MESILALFQDVIKTPDNPDVLWNYVQAYLTFLETQSDKLSPILLENSAKGNNLMALIKSIKNETIPWGVYNIFLTLSNIGTSIAQKKDYSESDLWYIANVMLSSDNKGSVTYDFTLLLQKLDNTDIYKNVNTKFLEAFKEYEPKPEKTSILSKKCIIAGREIYIMWIVLVVLLLVLGLGGVGWMLFFNKPPQNFDASKSISSFGSDLS